jgi:hypothetical protein
VALPPLVFPGQSACVIIILIEAFNLPGMSGLCSRHLQDQMRHAGGEGVRRRQAGLQGHQRLLREHRLPVLKTPERPKHEKHFVLEFLK